MGHHHAFMDITVTSGVSTFTEVLCLNKYVKIQGTCTLLQYFYFMQLYTSTLLHLRGKY